MAVKDAGLKNYFKDKVRFADLVNGTVYRGRQVLKAEELTEVSGESEIIMTDKDGKKQVIQRYRDVVMRAGNGEVYAVYAVENQTEVHYAMPVRVMLYDALSYVEQIKEIRRAHEREQRPLRGAEFLSGMQKTDKLIPIVTIVAYYGEEMWDGSMDLHGMLALDDEKMKEHIPNYKLNLLQVCNVEDPEVYKSSLHEVFGMLKYKSDKQQLKIYIEEHAQELSELDEETFEVLAEFLGEKRLLQKRQETGNGGNDMCKAIQEMVLDGKQEGKREGIKAFVELCREFQMPKEETAKKLAEKFAMSSEEANGYAEQYW